MTNKTPRIAKTRRESTTTGTRKTGRLFFFLSSQSSSFFRQLSSTLPQSVTMVFARNSSIFNRAVQRPIAFSLPPSLHQATAAGHSITMASFVTPFSRLYACALNDHLATIRQSQSQSVIETPVKGGIHATYITKIHKNKVKVFTAGTSLKLQPPLQGSQCRQQAPKGLPSHP